MNYTFTHSRLYALHKHICFHPQNDSEWNVNKWERHYFDLCSLISTASVTIVDDSIQTVKSPPTFSHLILVIFHFLIYSVAPQLESFKIQIIETICGEIRHKSFFCVCISFIVHKRNHIFVAAFRWSNRKIIFCNYGSSFGSHLESIPYIVTKL